MGEPLEGGMVAVLFVSVGSAGQPVDDLVLVVGWLIATIRSAHSRICTCWRRLSSPATGCTSARASRWSPWAQARSNAARRLGQSWARWVTPSISAWPTSRRCMSVTRRRPLRVSLGCPVRRGGLLESLGGALADGLQQPEPHTGGAGFDGENRLLDQVVDQLIDVGAVHDLVSDHAGCVREREGTGEYRQPRETFAESARGGRRTTGWSRGGSGDARDSIAYHRSGGRGGGPVGLADRRARVFLVRAAASSMANGIPSSRRQISGTVSREPAASKLMEIASARSTNSSTPAAAGVERPDGDELFTGDAERFPGCGEHLNVGASLGDGLSQLGRTVDDVRSCPGRGGRSVTKGR
jgi:hypothetical protein